MPSCEGVQQLGRMGEFHGRPTAIALGFAVAGRPWECMRLGLDRLA
jgi:hypothetical protein